MTIDVHNLVGAYAVDAVSEDEREAFSAHLALCEECRAELRGFEATAARMGDAAEMTPPAHLRESVLRAARTSPQQRTVVTHLDAHRWRRALPKVLTAAACALALALGGVLVLEHQRTNDLQAENSRVATILGADDLVTSKTQAADGGQVSFTWSASHDEGVVSSSGLPALDEDHAYQLWTLQGDEATPAGLLDVPDAGDESGTQVVSGLAGADELALTVEPAGGSEQPTSAPVAALTVT